MDNRNVAADGSRVDQQVGVHVGDTAFHNERIYHINQGDPPERRHEVALAHLVGGTPRLAEKLLGELLWNGFATTERAYYYFLAVLSDRSFNDIQTDLLTGIVNARKICKALPQDDWRDVFDVVWQLLKDVQKEFAGEAQDKHFTDVLAAFDRLAPDRQDEITRHLDMILGGVAQERLETRRKHHVVVERIASGRAERAWKFFETDPEKPRKYVPAPTSAEPSDCVRALLGGIGVVVGLIDLLHGQFRIGVLLQILLIAAGSYLSLWHGIAYESQVLRFCVREREAAAHAETEESDELKPWATSEFAKEIGRLVEGRFREARLPHILGSWSDYTGGIRAHLKRRIIELYWRRDVSPSALRWLIRWHAERVAAGWATRDLVEHRKTLVIPIRTKVLRYLGVVVAAVGLLAVVHSAQVLAALLLGVGGFFATKGVVRIAALRSMDGFIRDEAEKLHAEEMRGYEEWVAELADRPTDSEMARWLALDKAYLKTDVLKRANLTDRDLVTHVVMTEGAVAARRGRVLHGPPRYAAYTVHIFLLTYSGMRAMRVHLDFVSGEVRNERRDLFRYDALASASVQEKGIRTTAVDGLETTAVERLRSREFRLTLVNNQEITVVAENFKNWKDTKVEDESDLAQVAVQTSGIEGALPILEAVAAEGRNWIAGDQERRQRWSRNWYE